MDTIFLKNCLKYNRSNNIIISILSCLSKNNEFPPKRPHYINPFLDLSAIKMTRVSPIQIMWCQTLQIEGYIDNFKYSYIISTC